MKTKDFILRDNKSSLVSIGTETKMEVKVDARTEFHELTLSGISFYYSGNVGLTALRLDVEQLKSKGVILMSSYYKR